MHNLLDDLRNAPTPLIVKSKAGILKAVKDIHLAVLKNSLHLTNGIDVSSKASSLRRYALWLEDVVFEVFPDKEESDEVEAQESLFASAATLYEFTGNLFPDDGQKSIFQPPLNDWLRSAILSSFTTYQAHSSLIGRRVRRTLDSYRIEAPDIQCHFLVASTVAALVGRELHLAFTYSKRLDQLQGLALNALKNRDATNREILELDRALAIGRVCGKAALGLLIGLMPVVFEAIERLEQIKERAVKVDDANHYWLADRLLQLIQCMINASMHRILMEAELPNEYRHILARDQFLEFWGPQLYAIQQGLLDSETNKHFVISIPTGSGKTLFAELGLLTALKGRNPGWAMYVTPSRALVNQVSSDLRHRLDRCNITVRTVIAGAEQSDIFDEELDLLQMNHTVTVTTPEKLDAYYRNAQEIFESCRLIIFDEVHKISEPDRGPLIESLIARFLSIHPQTRILLLSGVMSNIDEMKSWLGEEGTVAVTERTRPTRRVYGVAVRGEQIHREPSTRRNGDTFRRVDYSGGLVVVHEREDLEGDLAIDLEDVFQGYYHERFYPKARQPFQWKEDRQAGHSSFNDHAIGLAQSIAKAPGTILIFMQSIDSVQRGCRELKYTDNAFQQERAKLASFIAAELGPDHPLGEYCRRGIAYHHARLPNSVQRAIELALERGWLKVVLATATLREGLNTAATTVIVAGHSLYDDAQKRRIPIPEADFLNLAGRAGRPRTDTEGRVFLIPDSLVQASAIENGKKYILAGDAALRVKSQFAELAKALNDLNITITDLLPAHQSILLGLEAAGLTDPNSIVTFIDHSLWSLQEDEEFTQITAGRVSYVIARAKEEIGAENLKVASRLGLSLSSSEQMRKLLVEQKELFTEDLFARDRKLEQIRVLLTASLLLPEIRKGTLRRNVNPEAHVAPLMQWIGGGSYQAILDASKEAEVLSANDNVTDAVKYASDISTWLSWSFGAAHSLLQSFTQEVDPYVGILPLLIKYGVSTTSAAYISLLGVSDRTAAEILGKQFEDTRQTINLQTVSNWLSSIENEIEKILAAHDHGLRTELITRQVFRGRYGRSPYQMTRFTAAVDITQGTILNYGQDDDRALLTLNGAVVGEMIDKSDLFPYSRNTLSQLVAVTMEPIFAGNTAAIALISSASA